MQEANMFNFMAAVTVHSDFSAQENKICPYFHFSPFYLPLNDGTRCHDLRFFNVEFKLASLLSSFTLIKRLLSLSLLSAIRVVSFLYLRVLIFLLALLIPACDSSSPAFYRLFSVWKLNKQSDSIEPCHAPFSIWNQSAAPCLVLTVTSWPAYRFLRRQVRWSGTPISWRIFRSLLSSIQPKAF